MSGHALSADIISSIDRLDRGRFCSMAKVPFCKTLAFIASHHFLKIVKILINISETQRNLETVLSFLLIPADCKDYDEINGTHVPARLACDQRETKHEV